MDSMRKPFCLQDRQRWLLNTLLEDELMKQDLLAHLDVFRCPLAGYLGSIPSGNMNTSIVYQQMQFRLTL